MTAQERPLEGKIRFSTRNAWDDPTFRVAIKGDDRARRRAEMQATIDLEEARRAGTFREGPDPVAEAPTAMAAPALVTSDATGARSERWACPGCAWSSDKGSAISTHKKSCAALYERRKAGESAPVKPVPPAPVAREPIQADTPTSAPACPIGQPAAPTVAAEEETMTATAERPRTAPKAAPRLCGCRGSGHSAPCLLAAPPAASPPTPEAPKKAAPPAGAAHPCDWPGCDHKASCPQALGRHKRAIHGVVGTSASAQKWAAREAAKITAPKPSAAYKCETCGKGFTSASALGGHRNTHTSAKAKREAVEAAAASSPYRPGSVADRAEKGDPKAIAEMARPEPWMDPAPEPPSLRCLVVRVRGAVPLEVECATPEDAAAFVRLVSAGGVS